MLTSRLYAKLPTEQNNPRSRTIDRISIKQALQLINREDQTVARAVARTIPSQNRAIQTIVQALQKGGRLFFLGAGTSGRLGILEAAECPPTFNTPPSLVQAFMAGGRNSVFRSKEGAEDQGGEARALVRAKIKTGDVLVGIAASGVTPFVRDGLRAAKKKKVKTILVTCSPKISRGMAQTIIAVQTGPEIIAGSTRLKAATATKMILNALTVVTMIQLGKVYQNWMVDLQPKSIKLKIRGARLIHHLGGVSLREAKRLLRLSGGKTKTGLLMAKFKINKKDAEKILKQTKGHLHKAFQLI